MTSVLFGDIYSSKDPTKYIAGVTKTTITNKLRVYFSATKTSSFQVHLFHVFPEPSVCSSPSLCKCIPREIIYPLELDFANTLEVDWLNCDESSVSSACISQLKCGSIHKFASFSAPSNATFKMIQNDYPLYVLNCLSDV